jgi:pheromone a factor receptor
VTYDRYFRLTILASLDLVFTVPLATWAIVGALLSAEVEPWISWADTHWEYSSVFQFPRVELDQLALVGLETTRWSAVLCAFVFFGFFGFSDEAKKNYRLLAYSVTGRFGYSTSTESTATPDPYVDPSLHFVLERALIQSLYSTFEPGAGSKSGIPLPIFNIQQAESKRDSFDSSSVPSSSNVIYPVDEVPRVPESALDPALVKRPPVPDAPKYVYTDKASDRV